jgi:hypothetical protein
MGGQACILYGAAEFSRDTDFAVLSSAQNLDRLREALLAVHPSAHESSSSKVFPSRSISMT